MSHKIQESADRVIYVSAAGEARVDVQGRIDRITGVQSGTSRSRADVLAAFEPSLCEAVMDRAKPPVECGDAIPVAPARGPMLAFTPRDVVRTDAGSYRAVKAGYMGRQAVRVADAFDQMTRDAVRAHRRAKDDGAFVAPFTVGQVEMGREYAALVERVSGAGVRCSSMEATGGGDGSGGGVQDAVLQDIQRLRVLRCRIGGGIAKRVVRRGNNRRAILDRVLVDKVCVEGLPIDTVLEQHGWKANGRERSALRAALCGALDRMRGYGLGRAAK